MRDRLLPRPSRNSKGRRNLPPRRPFALTALGMLREACAISKRASRCVWRCRYSFWNSVKVLIVDDSRMARLMLRSAVESLGHETLEAVDGQQAWDMLVHTGADVVVSDWMMPGLEGP